MFYVIELKNFQGVKDKLTYQVQQIASSFAALLPQKQLIPLEN